MKQLTEVLELRKDLIFPFLIILLDEVPPPLIVELLHETTILDVPQHLKIRLTLHFLVVPHTVEETLRPVLDLHEGSRAILIHLKPVNTPHNLVEGSLNRTYVVGVERIILHEFGLVRIGRLILITGSVVRVKGLAEVVFSDNHILS